MVDTHKEKVQYIAGGATQNTIRVAQVRCLLLAGLDWPPAAVVCFRHPPALALRPVPGPFLSPLFTQWMSGQPGFSAYVGAVGDDAFGKQLKASAEADGVAALYQVNTSKPTGTCAVIIHDKERSLVANLVAAETLTESHLESAPVAAAVSSAQIMYCAGFPLTHDGGAACALALGKHCAENGKTFAANLSAPFIVQVGLFLVSWMPDLISCCEEAMLRERLPGHAPDKQHQLSSILCCGDGVSSVAW